MSHMSQVSFNQPLLSQSKPGFAIVVSQNFNEFFELQIASVSPNQTRYALLSPLKYGFKKPI